MLMPFELFPRLGGTARAVPEVAPDIGVSATSEQRLERFSDSKWRSERRHASTNSMFVEGGARVLVPLAVRSDGEV